MSVTEEPAPFELNDGEYLVKDSSAPGGVRVVKPGEVFVYTGDGKASRSLPNHPWSLENQLLNERNWLRLKQQQKSKTIPCEPPK